MLIVCNKIIMIIWVKNKIEMRKKGIYMTNTLVVESKSYKISKDQQFLKFINLNRLKKKMLSFILTEHKHKSIAISTKQNN